MPNRDFTQIEWDDHLEDDCRQIVRLAVREDLGRWCDWTTLSLVDESIRGAATVVAREAGVIAGIRAAQVALDEMDVAAKWDPLAGDGAAVEKGTPLVDIAGPARDLLTSERILLNFIGRLSGIATLTRRYVEAIAGTNARVYDTRKTTPGWRRLEKHAVRCGGGTNHRTGLFDAVLIKDNHLALATQAAGKTFSPADAVAAAREFLRAVPPTDGNPRDSMIVEIEVDTLEQLADVLPAGPDVVLLDNMPPEVLRQAVALRNEKAPEVELEASGGIDLTTIRGIAETGVDRISVGALTHSATSLDVALDWNSSLE